MREPLQQYLERRAPTLTLTTTQFAEQFSTAFAKLAANLTPKTTAIKTDLIVGMGRPYNAIQTTFEGLNHQGERYEVIYTGFMQSPDQRSANGFTDPRYQIFFKQGEKNTDISLTVMGNGEIEISGKWKKPEKDQHEFFELNSWEIEGNDLLERLQQPTLSQILSCFDLTLEIDLYTNRI